ncbi:MAG: ATP-binding protein [Anaerolineae bacterium]|nr:ATP-binding protein [Anaerolineae bacterium]MDW8069653.1 ATP-binding protein [Anaerolineae bacterium]
MTGNRPPPISRRQRFLSLSVPVRGKIIFPYLVLTILVAVIGTYVVTYLVAGSLDERLTNHLLEAGRVVSDGLARYEVRHLEAARMVAFTRGLGEALQAKDTAQVAGLATPVAAGLGTELLVIVDADDQPVLHLLRRPDGSYGAPQDLFQPPEIVRTLLAAGDPAGSPRRGLARHPTDGRYYYLTTIPVPLHNRLVGAVIVGTSLDTLLLYFKSTSMADVTVYLDGGRAVGTTFAIPEQPLDAARLLDELSIPVDLYERCLYNPETTVGENVQIRGRWYRLARGPLRVGNDVLGVFGVALPAQFIVRAGTTSRNIYALLFGLMTGAVIVIGYLIARRITHPLERLAMASQAIAEGDLSCRTGIRGTDEIGVLATTFDEMAARLLERTQALEETLGQLRAILASIGDGVILEDAQGNLIPLNAAAEYLLNELASHFIMSPLRELPAADVRPDSADNPWLVESRRFQIGNKVVSAHSAIVRTEEGQRLGTVIVLRDVTAEVEAEQLKDAFVAHVSHELRTPLTAIRGYSNLLLAGAGGPLSDQQQSFLQTIAHHTEALIAMIGTLLDFSEMEAGGRLALRKRPVALRTLVEELAREWRPRLEASGLNFQVEIPDRLPSIHADSERLRWALINLLRNASQYTPQGGTIALRITAQDDGLVLEVADTGTGIPPEVQRHLFTRFYRGIPAADDTVRGLGLGLYITRAIVEAHGGQIQVFSEPGTGSTFRIYLPCPMASQEESHRLQEQPS